MSELILGGVIGFVLSFGLYYFDKLIEPDLDVQVSDPSELKLKQGKFKALNLKISNKKKAGILKFLNKPATLIKVYLYFSDYPTATLMHTVIARWNNSREPLTPDYTSVDIGLALTNPREVLVPGEENTISVAIRKDDKRYCFPFYNTSYIYHKTDFEIPSQKIEDEKFIVVVRVQSAETDKFGGVFIVLNKSNLAQFKIEKLPEPRPSWLTKEKYLKLLKIK